jgi:hypothetical protein
LKKEIPCQQKAVRRFEPRIPDLPDDIHNLGMEQRLPTGEGHAESPTLFLKDIEFASDCSILLRDPFSLTRQKPSQARLHM